MPENGRTKLNLLQYRACDRAMAYLRLHASERMSVGRAADRAVERHAVAMERELAEISLTEAEASAVVDCYNGTMTDPPEMARMLPVEIADAVRLDGLVEKWGIDGPALLAKLASLTFSQQLAIVESCEAFWASRHQYETQDDALKAVGLVR